MWRKFARVLATTGFAALAQMPCEQLKSLKLENATITLAEPVTAGPFLNPAAPRAATATAQMLPAHCRVAATLRPGADSDIKIEVWLPAGPEWNGKFQAVGGGGWAGVISYGALAAALQEGYTTSSTDTGHESSNPGFAVRHPEKVVDFSHRAVHEMTVKAKAIISAHYGRGPRFSYWTGCSTGGRQGLMEAQRYPEDFDGIIAGAPAIHYTHLCAWRLALEASVLKDPARAVPSGKLTLLNNAVLAACDALDGVKDGLLTDPRQCHFDPSTLLCRASESDHCLTAPQVEAVRMAYAPARKGNGEMIQYVAHENPNWDWRTFDLERDTELADEKGGYMNAINPDLSAFKRRGGKLLIYHGWNDGASGGSISPLTYPSHYAGFELANPLGISEGYRKVFTTATTVWQVLAQVADEPATP